MVPTTTLLSVMETLDFDTKSGVHQCAGEPDFYSDLDRELYEAPPPLGTNVLQAIDPQQQREYAHKLKGTLSTPGARGASSMASEFERTLREGRPEAPLAEILLREINRIPAGLSAVFER